jgi:hypothetical protein
VVLGFGLFAHGYGVGAYLCVYESASGRLKWMSSFLKKIGKKKLGIDPS